VACWADSFHCDKYRGAGPSTFDRVKLRNPDQSRITKFGESESFTVAFSQM